MTSMQCCPFCVIFFRNVIYCKFQIIWSQMFQMQSNDFSSRLGTKSTRTGVPLGLFRLRFLQKTIKHRRRIWYQWKSSALQVALHGNNWRRLHIVRWYVFRLVLLCMLQQQNRNLKCTMLEILDNGDSESHTKKKTKRMRTTFTEEQVQILQANFQIDSNTWWRYRADSTTK